MLGTRFRQFNAVLAVFLFGAARATADEIRTWRDAEGRRHYSITGSAPDESEAAPVETGQSPDKFSVEASLRRRAIENGLRKRTRELETIGHEIHETEEKGLIVSSPGVFGGRKYDPGEVQQLLDAQRNALLQARAFEDERKRKLDRLYRKEHEKLLELKDLWRNLEELRAEVREFYGASPSWWRDKIDCGNCPKPEEIEEALAPPEDRPEEPEEEEPSGGASDDV